MDSYIPMGGMQLPSVHRRLSRLYNDTKKSSDFVKEPVQNAQADPDIKSLHRKLRIQKDRLVTWGLAWSDPNQSAEVLIDLSLSKAGLSEVVSSIMSTIQGILAEAEPLWHSSRRLAGETGEPERPRGEKIKLVVWDKNRFEDLLRDLTTSIDTLYDLSRTRSSNTRSLGPREKPAAEPEHKPFASSRILTPPKIDPKSLTNLRSREAEPMTERAERERERAREVVFMDKKAYAEIMGTTVTRPSQATTLLREYAPFDSIYSVTGISPPMTRFEKLFAGLQSEPQRAPGSWTGLPRLLGYYEDMDNSRFGLVYQFPTTFNPVSFEHLTQNPLYNLCSLADLLARPDFEPKLEAKFRLAANLANTVFDMHARGITHGNLVDENVSFCNAVGTDPEVSGITQGEVDIRRPLVSSFDLFSDPQSPDEPRTYSPYRHPLDPRNSASSPLANNADSKTFDLYSLAMVLLSVGLWTKIENLVPDPTSAISESVLAQLAIRCGTLYMKAVEACWSAVDQELSGFKTTEQIVSRAQFKASRYLEACCILDGVSNLEERLGDDLGEVQPKPAQQSSASTAGPSKESSEKTDGSSATGSKSRRSKLAGQSEEGQAQTRTAPADPSTDPPRRKTRLYTNVALPPDLVERWNNDLMPQISGALKHFYRKHPESVEISLHSIGESPQKTQPTVLVVCTSVSKVRSILKKKLGALFDGTTGLGLKVCHGQVVRSRKEFAEPVPETPSDREAEDDVIAANPRYQKKPQNGASLGAYIGYHLPPVSLGGMIMVDGKQYGMTVHHMLDDPEQGQEQAETEAAYRSMAGPHGMSDLAAWYAQQYQNDLEDADSSGTEDSYAAEFSDSDSDTFSESAITSEASDDEEDQFEEGDVPGIEPGCGGGYVITQPALDDVPEGFYPSEETKDEDHVDSSSVGRVYASSGIRRRTEGGCVHEIDWALFEFEDERQPEVNHIPRARGSLGEAALCPTSIVPTTGLAGLEVQCMARTSGLQTGRILPAMVSLKLHGRTSASVSYQIAGSSATTTGSSGPSLAMGVPGDSGAWVVDRHDGRLCGHILAWSERKRVAYICPMEVLVHDIAETLEATEIRLPGAAEPLLVHAAHVYKRASTITDRSSVRFSSASFGDMIGGEPTDARSLYRQRNAGAVAANRRSLHSQRASYHQTSSANTAGEEDSLDEGVEDVEANLGKRVKGLRLSSASGLSGVEPRRWGLA